MLTYLPKPASSFLQWHITERCNLRCKHCYQTSYETPEMPLSKMLSIVDEYVELLDLWGIVDGRMQVTGGEPFVRKDIFEILEKIYENRQKLRFTIMSNGFYVTKDIAKKLKDLGIKSFQISIEGEEQTNDYIRGKGAFKKIVEAAKILVEEGIDTSFSFTATSINSKEYFKVLEIAKTLGVHTLWSDRLVPWGAGKQIQDQMLQPIDLKQHYEKITKISKDLAKNGSKTRLSRNRTLYFMADPKRQDHAPWANHCDAVGTRGMTVLCDGTVYPCRRLPIKVGNVMEQSLFEIWYANEWMWKLRDKNNYKNEKCGNCELFERCGGGAPCIAYGYSGTPFATDPQCWKAFDKIQEAEELAKAAIVESDKEPEYWEHVIVQDKSKDLGEYFELNDRKIYYCNGLKVEVKDIEKENGNAIYLSVVDLEDFEIDNLLNKIENKSIKKLFISLKNVYGENAAKNKTKIITFLAYLKNKEINFKLTMPLPRGWFGFDYYRVSRALNAPTSWKDSLELFYVEDGKLKIRNVINIDGPKLKYMPSRNQIYEFFSYFYNKPKRLQKPKEELIKVKYTF